MPQLALLAATLDHAAVGLLVVDSRLRVVLWNRWMADTSGVPRSWAVGRALPEIFPGCSMRRLHRKVRGVLALGNQAFIDARRGEPLFPLSRPSPLEGDDIAIAQSCTLAPLAAPGDPAGLVCISVTDHTAAVHAERALQQAHADLQKTARTDTLTGLLNRPTVCGILEEELRRRARTAAPLSVLLFDIDHFKRVNDTWGHLGGDAVLREVGAAARRNARETDRPGRYGGEEFLVVLPDTDAAGAQLAARRLRASIRDLHVVWAGQHIPVTASFGVATARDAESVESLLNRADEALYGAKRDGRDCVRIAA